MYTTDNVKPFFNSNNWSAVYDSLNLFHERDTLVMSLLTENSYFRKIFKDRTEQNGLLCSDNSPRGDM